MVRVSTDSARDIVGRPRESAHKPGLTSLLSAVGLDVAYTRGSGDHVYYNDDDGAEVEVLDLVAGFGVTLFGHNAPELVAAAQQFLQSGSVNHAQGSIRAGARRLAEALERRVGEQTSGQYHAVFANSGAEAVEVALKHAMLETGNRTVVALQRAFHGKTLGALQATSNPFYQKPFLRGRGDVVRVEPNDLDQLKSAFDRIEDLAGFLFEPIQGESGVRPLDASFLHAAESLCRRRGVPMIADESQTGLGRTGHFLASEAVGVKPDYVILSKALGGGLSKISAVLIRRDRYRPEFDLLHSSTFADDEFSCHLALRTLEMLDDAAIRRAKRAGRWCLDRLRDLQRRYPEVIADVRGRGLMIGLEFRQPDASAGFMVNHLADRSLLCPLLSGYLLNEHAIRIAPTISNPRTLRIQPSLRIGRDQIRRAVAALDETCARLAARDFVGLTRFLADRKPPAEPIGNLSPTEPAIYRFDHSRRRATTASRLEPDLPRVAWLFHLIDSSDLVHVDPAFCKADHDMRDRFCDHWSRLCEPVAMNPVVVRSAAGTAVRLFPILLPVTSQWMLRRGEGSRTSAPSRLVQRGVDVASQLGCHVVSLGQFTSIATRRGRNLNPHAMQITSGNNYTAALIRQAVFGELQRRSVPSFEQTLAIVGAAGDVAGTCAAMMATAFKQCLLIGSGRAGAIGRLERVAKTIPGASVSTDLASVASADVVICATNSTTAPLGPQHLHPDAIVCDASVPATLHGRLSAQRPNVTVLPGAVVRLPHEEAIDIPGFPLAVGKTFGCMAEGLLIGLDQAREYHWSGRSSERRAEIIAGVAERHGFCVDETAAIDRNGVVL